MTATTSSHTAVITLPTDTQILITREFAAPKHLLYRASTEPELVKRWWSGDRGVVTVVDVDVRVGGKWRYVMTANGGFEVAFHGEYLEVVPNGRLVYTEVFEGIPNAEDAKALVTVTFEEKDGRTTLAILTEHTNRENRDMHVNSGMEGGLQEALDKLEQLTFSML